MNEIIQAEPVTEDRASEGTDLVIQTDQPVVAAPVETMVDPVLAQAAAIARIPGLNESMFDRLMGWQERERAAQAEERFNETMNRCQAEIEPIARTAENKQTGSFYAKLEAVDAAIRPIYSRHGFAVKYNTVSPLTPGNIRVECAVSLGRHTERFYREAPADTLGPKGTATKTALHGGGSSETYLKRYAVSGAFNVVFRTVTDDDGVRGGMSFVGPDQVKQLRDMANEAGRDERKFLKGMVSRLDGTAPEAFEEVESKDFVRLSNTLHLIINQKKERSDAQDNT